MTPPESTDFVENPTVPSVYEQQVITMGAISKDALEGLAAAAVRTWKMMWEDVEGRSERFAVMGTKAPDALEKHHKTILFLEEMNVEIPDFIKTPPPDFVIPE